MTDAPDPLPLSGNDDDTAHRQPASRRWLVGISLAVGLNLAIMGVAFVGLSVQHGSLNLELDKAVTEQAASASEMISNEGSNAQAAGFRALERVARILPSDRERVVDLAEAYLTRSRPQPGRSRAAPPSASYTWRTWAGSLRWT